jgi:hypothetical protein
MDRLPPPACPFIFPLPILVLATSRSGITFVGDELTERLAWEVGRGVSALATLHDVFGCGCSYCLISGTQTHWQLKVSFREHRQSSVIL